MHILCTICSDIVNQAESIYVTKCGHLFHYHCLSQWIERSRTCPQCRCKVTDSCMFRVFPTAAGGGGEEDASTLQARLDDVQLRLRQLAAQHQDAETRLAAATAAADAAMLLRRAGERRQLAAEAAAAALREQITYLKIQNQETQRLQQENEALANKLITLTELGKVLSATAEDVELMLHSNTDVKTIATFATALKRALCEAERGKREAREARQRLRAQLATERERVDALQLQLSEQRALVCSLQQERGGGGGKRRRSSLSPSPPPPRAQDSPPSPGRDAHSEANEAATERPPSPYLALRAGPAGVAGGFTLKPTEQALVAGSARYSIFPAGRAAARGGERGGAAARPREGEYDGLGGRGRLSPPRLAAPRPGARHRLKRPAPSLSISVMFQNIRDK